VWTADGRFLGLVELDQARPPFVVRDDPTFNFPSGYYLGLMVRMM
jgi:hypothetical protein